VIFTADDGLHGRELWRSDGTEAGTWLVKELQGLALSAPREFTKFGGRLFFSTGFGELAVSDGSPEGTHLVEGLPGLVAGPTAMGGSLFFFYSENRDSPWNGMNLYRSDGTAPGTFQVKDLVASGWSAGGLVPAGDKLFFLAYRIRGGGSGLWVSDGTEQGTALAREFGKLDHITGLRGRALFVAQDPDGTA